MPRNPVHCREHLVTERFLAQRAISVTPRGLNRLANRPFTATLDEKLDLWLIGGAERFRRDAELRRALLAISRHKDSRRCLLLLESILETPSLSERLLEVLRPEEGVQPVQRRTPLLVAAEQPPQVDSAMRKNGSRVNGAKGNGAGSNSAGGNGSKRGRGGSKR